MTDSRAERKARYHKVLRTIAHNTTDEQPPGIRATQIATHIAGEFAPLTREDIDTVLRAARENGDIVRWTDREGQYRITLATKPDLERLVAHLAEVLEDPDQLGRVNTRLQEVRESDA